MKFFKRLFFGSSGSEDNNYIGKYGKPTKSRSSSSLKKSFSSTSSNSNMAPPPSRRSSLLIRKGSAASGPTKEIELDQHYKIIRKLGSGKFSQVYVAEDRQTKTQIALRTFSKSLVKPVDFIREYNFSYFLSPHPNIVDTYECTYSTADLYFFVQDYTPYGTLNESVEAASGLGLPEATVQIVIGQLVSALEFMHTEGLVHRNLHANNVLVYARDLSKVKLTDFGMTKPQGTLVKNGDNTLSTYHAPELCEILQNEGYCVDKSADVWSLGIMIYYCLRVQYPWSKASITCKQYYEWEQWLKRKTLQIPHRFQRFTDDGLKMFKRILTAKPKDRCSIKEVKKFLKDKWIREIKSISDDMLCVADSEKCSSYESAACSSSRKSQSVSDVPSNYTPRSILQHWITATISTMTEISEQVVSATDER